MKLTLPVLLFVTLLLALPANANAMFPGRNPLHMWWEDSDIVVCANVTAAKDIEDESIRRVDIKLVEIVKPGRAIDQEFHYVESYPTNHPPVEKGARILAFLKWDAEKRRWSALAIVQVDEMEQKQFTRMLKKLPEVLKPKDQMQRRLNLRDWYFECTLLPELRHEGLMGLSGHGFTDAVDGKRKSLLTNEHRRKFVDTVTVERPPHASTAGIAKYLDGV